MKKHMKGFTLVELLAVLVILAILALIVVPIVLKTINNSNESALESSFKIYTRAAEQGVLSWATDKGKATFEVVNNWNDFEMTYGDYIEYKGNRIKCISASVNSNGNVTLIGCTVGDNQNNSNQGVYNYANNEMLGPYTMSISNEEIDAILLGDVNGDKEITKEDSILISNYISKLETFDERQLAAADINKDGNINAMDATTIEQIIEGVIDYTEEKVCPKNTDSIIYILSNDKCTKYEFIK